MDTNTATAERVGRNVATALTQAGVSVKAAAEATGIPRTTLSRHLAGKGGGFSVVQLEQVGKALNLDPVIFWGVIR